jgi:hypothetical protein
LRLIKLRTGSDGWAKTSDLRTVRADTLQILLRRGFVESRKPTEQPQPGGPLWRRTRWKLTEQGHTALDERDGRDDTPDAEPRYRSAEVVAVERQRQHSLLMQLEGLVSDLEFHLPIIRDALQGVEHPMAHRSLKTLDDKVRLLAGEGA